MDCPYMTPGRRGAGGLRGGREVSYSYLAQHPSEILLPGASKKHHHCFFPFKFSSGICL